jgi:GNAT superfamily N-acetyltransferase
VQRADPSAGGRKIAADVSEDPRQDDDTIVLRDGRVATVALLQAADEPAVEALLTAGGGARAAFYARVRDQRSLQSGASVAGGEFVAHVGAQAEVAGYAAYLPDQNGEGECAGEVDPRFAGVGLGTRLLLTAAEHAQSSGVKVLRVELHPGSEATAAMLRDAGIVSRWTIAYPVTRVALALGTTRPGWATPVARTPPG